MEVILGQNDASDWIYRGEGAVNLVLAYTGSAPAFVGKVMRIQKAPKNGSVNKSLNGAAVLSCHEQLLWRENEELVSSESRDIFQQKYVEHVMTPLLGPKHVDAGVRVLASTEFLEYVGNRVVKHRPSWRVNAANVDTHRNSVLLMDDHSLFIHGIGAEDDCLSVEIKPKCGFLPSSRFISHGNTIKKSISRFKMHQLLKLQLNEVPELSEYDPLELFSGCKNRIYEAIRALYSTPHNNFRVFLNGDRILGGKGRTTSSIEQSFEEALKDVVVAEDGQRTGSFLQLVTEAVYSSGVLDRLLEAQKLDNLDIEGAIHAYYNIISQPCAVCREFESDEMPLQYKSLHTLPLEESLKIVKNYLISATAKDCSLMICFRPRQAEHREPSYNSIYLESTGQVFDYKVNFIDLDLKPLEKMEFYYELDKKIVSCYTQKLNGENGETKAVNLTAFESKY